MPGCSHLDQLRVTQPGALTRVFHGRDRAAAARLSSPTSNDD